jgi:hypothetical protein
VTSIYNRGCGVELLAEVQAEHTAGGHSHHGVRAVGSGGGGGGGSSAAQRLQIAYRIFSILAVAHTHRPGEL